MKTLTILKTADLLSIIIFTSCKKDLVSDAEKQIPSNDLKLASMIKGFKARGESHLKSATEMSVDSAIWYIGATANFTYGDASRETERTWLDTIFVTLPITTGKITEGDVYNKYQEVINSLSEKYQARNEENKQLIAATISTQSVSSSDVVCRIIAIFAYGLPTNIPCSFNNIDHWSFWKYWQNGGICDGPNGGLHPESDAAIETQKRIMNCRAVPAGNYWYEPLPNNQGTITINDPTQYPIDNSVAPSNNRYAHLYWNSSALHNPDENGCINPGDLNFYLSKTKELIYNDTDHNGIRPVGSSFISISMWGFILITPQNNTVYMHRAVVNYGILHVSPYQYYDLP